MKTTWLSLPLAAAVLSGCSNMMYGGGIAPVTNGNVYYGQPVNQTPVNQQAAVRQPVQTQPVYPQQQVLQQPVQQTVTRVQNVPPSVRQQAQQPAIQETSASPYAQTPAAAPKKTASADDGWSVKPGSQLPIATDTPKVAQTPAQQPPADTPASPAKKDAPAPLRPPQASEQTQAQTPSQPAQAPQRPSTPAQNTAPASEPAQQQTQVAKVAPKTSNSGGSAVSTLLKKANGELGKGNLDGAAAYLEDAQRIDSKNAKILYDIANIRYHQGRYRDAEAAAARAVNAGGSASMQKKSWSLIANARKQLGDNQGAVQAAEKASSF